MHPHANTCAHLTYTCEQYVQCTHVHGLPTCIQAYTDICFHPHSYTHLDTMFTMPMHIHAHTEHQVYETSPESLYSQKHFCLSRAWGSLQTSQRITPEGLRGMKRLSARQGVS